MNEEAIAALLEVLQQINELSGAALDALMGGAEAGGPPPEDGAGAPAPDGGPPAGPPAGPPPA